MEEGGGDDKREFCKRCWKAAVLCMCGMIGEPIRNRIRVSVLQHPEEKEHHLGSVRVAVLGLANVELISVPQTTTGNSYRLRPKVPGSRRCSANNSQHSPAAAQAHNGLHHDCYFNGCATMDPLLPRTPPPWINLSPNAALIFPSDRALDLRALFPEVKFGRRSGADDIDQLQEQQQEREKIRVPDQIIVLDGTWSKARRLYMENPWLFQLPHYKLPHTFKSMYEFVRSEPRAGCMSTLEGIVYALKVFEPETQGLETLLDVFEAMIKRQQEYMLQQKKKNMNKR